ncbi:MAG TPA: porin, partial [Planctomycetota bacterium]|nr:porin [Planctomycetota bacterium]
DAYINFHGVIPHHDYSIGQFKPAFGEEGIRSNAQLDFVERSFVGQLGDRRDLGIQAHGTWWDDRFQYWIGAFNGAGNYYGSAGDFQNRSDDNDEKDFSYRVLLRPLWKNECWGSIELGFSSVMGTKGESAGQLPLDAPVNGLNRNQSWAIRHAGWASYLPGGPVKGLWLRGEWGYIKDRNAPGTVVDVANVEIQQAGKPFVSTGWYAAAGYKISDSVFCDSAPGWIKPFEVALRYDTFENVQVADLTNQNHTDNFSTNVWTVGLNYYIKGHDAKIQMNYNIVEDPDIDNDARSFHDVKNNSFVVNFQVAF